jgi:hypothetical protein
MYSSGSEECSSSSSDDENSPPLLEVEQQFETHGGLAKLQEDEGSEKGEDEQATGGCAPSEVAISTPVTYTDPVEAARCNGNSEYLTSNGPLSAPRFALSPASLFGI